MAMNVARRASVSAMRLISSRASSISFRTSTEMSRLSSLNSSPNDRLLSCP